MKKIIAYRDINPLIIEIWERIKKYQDTEVGMQQRNKPGTGPNTLKPHGMTVEEIEKLTIRLFSVVFPSRNFIERDGYLQFKTENMKEKDITTAGFIMKRGLKKSNLPIGDGLKLEEEQ